MVAVGTVERVFQAESVVETQRVAAKLARAMARTWAETKPTPRLVAGLVGELGAGKTTFVQGFIAALRNGAQVRVTSPTFALVHQYPTSPPVHHFDLYRLSGADALDEIGFHGDAFFDGITLVEWIRQVPEAIPDAWIEIEITLAPQPTGARQLRLCAYGEPVTAVLECMD